MDISNYRTLTHLSLPLPLRHSAMLLDELLMTSFIVYFPPIRLALGTIFIFGPADLLHISSSPILFASCTQF